MAAPPAGAGQAFPQVPCDMCRQAVAAWRASAHPMLPDITLTEPGTRSQLRMIRPGTRLIRAPLHDVAVGRSDRTGDN